MSISVVINTFNEEENIERAIRSVKWANEILVCDMQSDDNTAVIARRLGAIVFFHKRVGFVEPARNFAISKASGDWILILDADEEVPEGLAEKLQEIAQSDGVLTHVEIPRKNLVFNKWIKASNWWPDYHPRFFKAGCVKWSDRIHSKPEFTGQGVKLLAEESLALIHYHYSSLSQYIDRLNRYTKVQAEELIKDGYKFDWKDLIKKPLSEFLGRFFANRGFEDGMHGLALSLLQAFSFLILYLKVWEKQGFKEEKIDFPEIKTEADAAGRELDYWFKYGNLSKNPLKAFLQRARNKIS